MEQKIYTYGNFPFGLGAFGTGPVIEEEEESMLVKYNTGGQKIYTSLTSYGDVVLASAANIAIGDVQVSLDDGAFQNIASSPVVNNTRITITLSDLETSCEQLQIRFQDQTNPPEWNPKVINVETYGNSNAYVVDSLNNVVSASNFVATDISSLATSAQVNIVNQNVLDTSAAVKLIPIDNNGIIVSASNFAPTDLTSVMNALYSISAVTSQFTFSGSNVNANVANSGVLNNISISDILGSNIDGMTLEDALTKMLAWTLGNTAYSSDVFTYFKQDNSTPAFAISATDTTRTRL